jgi:CRISPR-associated protein Csd2
VRSFGQVFAFKSSDKKESVSVGVRGPVSIHQAVSCSPVDINSMQITKSVNSEPSEKKSSDTMGTKHFVEFGLYKVKGSINVQLAEKTGFSEEDADKIKEALRTLFINDASSARPDGSMEVVQVYWWRHNNKIGQYSAAKVHDSLKIKLKDGVVLPESVEDYDITLEPLQNLEPEIIEGI